MSFALGSQTKMGSAVAYLLVDPKSFSKGLAKAGSEIEDFYKATEKSAAASEKAKLSKKSFADAEAAKLSRTEGELHKLQSAVTSSSLAINQANQKRLDAQNEFSKAFHNASTAEIAARKNQVKAADDLGRAERRLQKLQANPPAQATRGRFAPGGKTIQQTYDAEVAAASARVDAARTKLQKTTDRLTIAEKTLADVSSQEAAVMQKVTEANAEAAASMAALEKEYEAAALNRRRTFSEFGPQVQRRIDLVEKAEKRELESFRKLEAARQATAAQRQVVSTAPTDLGAQTRLQALEKEEAAAAARHAKIVEQRIESERALTYAIDGEVSKRGRAYARDAENAEAAALAQKTAKKDLIAGGISKVSAVAAKGFIASALVIGVATAAFVSFQKAMTNVFSIMDASDSQIADITQRVRELSVELGKSPTELADGLYEIAQAGFSASESISLLNVAGQAATAGLTTVNAAAKPLIAVLKGYDMGVEHATEVSDKLFVGVTQGIFTFEELSSQIGDNVPLAHALGVSIDDLVTSYILLTKQGNSLSESTTQLNGIMNALLKPTDKLSELLQKMGYASGEAILADKGLIGTVQALQQQFGLTNEQLAEIFPNIRGLRGEIGLLNVTNEDLVQTQSQVANSLGTTNEVFKKQTESVAFQLAQMREAIRGAAIDLGATFAPSVVFVAEKIKELASAFTSLSPAMKNTIGGVTLFVAGASATILVLAQIVTSVMRLVEVLQTLQRTIGLVNLATAATGWGALVIVLGVVAELYMRHRAAAKDSAEALERQRQSVARLTSAYSDLKKKIDDILLQNKFGLGAAAQNEFDYIEKTRLNVNDEYKALDTDITRLKDLLKPENLTGPYFAEASGRAGGFDKAYQNVKDEIADMEAQKGRLAGADDVATKAANIYGAALSDERIDLDAVTTALNFLLKGYDDHTLTAPVVIAQMDDMSTHMSRYRIEQQKTDEQKQADQAATEEQIKAYQALSDAMDVLVDKTMAQVAGKEGEDVVPWLKGVQQGLVRAGDTTAKIMNRMIHQTKGGILKNIDPDLKRAIDLQRNLERAQEGIDKVTESISTNQSDMGMWNDRISLVTDTLGLNTDSIDLWRQQLDDGTISTETFNANIEALTQGPLPKLQKLIDDNKISQEEADKVRENAAYLIERSVGGIEDETAAQVDNINTLAAFIKSHDDAAGAINNATDAQRGFIQAMQDGGPAAAVQTLQMLAYLASIHAIPAQKVTDFIATASMDPEIKAFFQQIGLLDENGVAIPFTADGIPAIKSAIGDATGGPDGEIKATIKTVADPPDLKNIDTAKNDLKNNPVEIPTKYAAPAGAPGAGTGGTQQTTDKPAAAQPTVPTAPAEQTAKLTIDIEIDDAGKKSMDQIYDRANDWPDKVSTAFTFTGGSAGGGSAEGGGASSGFDATIAALGDWESKYGKVSTDFTFTGGIEGGESAASGAFATTALALTNWSTDHATVTTAFTFTGGLGSGEAPEAVGFVGTYMALKNWLATVTTTFDFVPDVEFQTTFDQLYTAGTAAQANLDILRGTLNATFVTIATDASNMGGNAGDGFTSNFTTGIDMASSAANAEVGEIRGQLAVSFYGEGSAAGSSFVQGFANGITSGWIGAYTAAYELGESAKQGVKDSIAQGSPSRKAFESGQSFTQGLVLGMQNDASQVYRTAQSLGYAMTSGVSGVYRPGTQSVNASVIASRAQPQMVVHQHNYALSASDLQKVLTESQTGADFARTLTRELDVRR